MKNDFKNSKFEEERLKAIKNFETGIKVLLASLYIANLSIAIKEGRLERKNLEKNMQKLKKQERKRVKNG